MEKLILCPDTEVSPDITLSDNGTCFEMIWETGHRIDTQEYDLSCLEFVCETHQDLPFVDYYVSDLGCSVVSDKLRMLFDTNGINNIEYFPASIKPSPDGIAKGGFHAANIVGLVDCIDTDKSEMDAELDDNGRKTIIYHIDKLVLKKQEIDSGYLYRAFPFERIILIAAKFKELFAQHGIIGAKCVDPARWDGYNGELPEDV